MQGVVVTSLIVTMPRSGTWYIKHVFGCLGVNIPVVHGLPPEQGNPFWHPDQNHGSEQIAKADRIVNVVRENAFEQMLSYYRHCINHKNQTHMFAPDGSRIRDFEHFVRVAGGPAYRAHWIAFLGQANVMRVHYENLRDHPSTYFAAILDRFDYSVIHHLLDKATEDCSRDNLSRAERTLKLSLADDQQPGSFHIKDQPNNKFYVPETGEMIDPAMVKVCNQYRC